MAPLAMEVSPAFAAWWTLGSAVVGGVIVWVFGPPVYAWWQAATVAFRLGLERCLIVVGVVALLAGALWLAAYGAG